VAQSIASANSGSASAYIHGALALGSFAPSLFGSAASLADSLLYFAQGDRVNGGIALGAAALGIASDAGLARLGLKGAQVGVDALRKAGGSGGFLYRGVHASHPAIDAAREGSVIPGNVNGTISAAEHNAGGLSSNSPFTSWTTNIDIARGYAKSEGPGGVLLRVPEGAPPPGASWSWHWSPDQYGESEVLLRGTRSGAEVFPP